MSPDIDKRSILIVAALGSFLTPFGGSSVVVALPDIQNMFSIQAILLSWVQTAYLLSAAVCLVPFGRLADMNGHKKSLLVGISLFTLAAALGGLSVSTAMLIGSRALQGVGSALIFVSGLSIVTAVFPPGERGKAIGITVGGVYVGLSLGPVLGGLLTQHLGWRSVFLINVPLGLAALGLIHLRIKTEWRTAAKERFDLAGSLLYGLSLLAFMYGASRLPAAAAWPMIIGGAIGLVCFVLWEKRTANPVFEVRLFWNNRAFAFSNLAALINYSATFAVSFMLSLYLQYIQGLSPQQAGLILLAQPVVMAVTAPVSGRLSDRIAPRVVASLGMALTSLGLLMLGFLNRATPIPLIVGNLLVLGLGFGLFSSPNTNAIMSSVEKRFLGIASGSVSTMRLLGQMFSMGIATLLFALLIGPVQITPPLYPQFLVSVRTAFFIFAGMCFLGVFASLSRGTINTNSES